MSSANSLILMSIVVKAVLLVVLGLGITRILRHATASVRHVVWLMVIAGTLFVPAIAFVAPMRVAMLPHEQVMTPSATTNAVSASPEITSPGSLSAPSTILKTSRTSAPTAIELALLIWAAVASFLLLRLARSMTALNRVLRNSEVVSSGEWHSALVGAANELGLTAVPRLFTSEHVEIAFTCSPLSPVIVVPATASEWSSDRRRAVLLHELAHIRRRDLVSHAIANVACSVYWFNPFVWVAADRLRMESELACDDVVLDAGIRPSAYAQHLLDMVTSFGKGAPQLALAIARPREFEGRLLAILDRTRLHVFGRNERRAMVGAVGILSVSIGAISPVPVRIDRAEPLPPVSLATSNSDAVDRDAPHVAPSPTRLVAGGGQMSESAQIMLRRLGTRAVVSPMMSVLGQETRLQLSGAQADSLAMLNWEYSQKVSVLWRPILDAYAKGNSVPVGDIPQRTVDLMREMAPIVRGLLSGAQFEKLDAKTMERLNDNTLRELRRRVVTDPGELILANGPGARIGGGGTPIANSAGRGRAGR